MDGIKHLVQCHCVLPTLRKLPDPVYHSFVVFSVLDDGGNVVQKDAECTNCGVIHRVTDICKSEITTKESSTAIITTKDISLMIPTDLANVLVNYSCDIATWEHAHFIYSNQKWGERVILTRQSDEGAVKGKMLTFEGPNRFKIESFEMSENF
jgi:hypothetical protein